MTNRPTISVFVRLKYWDIYRVQVVLMTIIFRKLLYIFGFVAVLWLISMTLAFLRPAPEQNWFVIIREANPIWWVLGLPILFIFVMPLLAARRILRQPRVKEGVRYQFSEEGIHVETSVAKSDLSWNAILKVKEIKSAFMLFTNPNIAHALPKSCVENPQDVPTLRELFRTYIKKSQLRTD